MPEGAAGAGISVSKLSKAFGQPPNRVVAVDALDLEVARGEVVALLGPSGCGKTTMLRCIAGLETPDSGEIRIGGEVVFGGGARHVPAQGRRLGMVFQSYALWPHMSVFRNVAYPLKAAGRGSAEIERRVASILDLVGCGHLAKRFPSELSGGQQQRVSLARALVAEPPVVLFDEPLSNLDARLRDRMRFELVELQEKLGFTAIYVTHDHSEALTVADRIALMGGGRILQLGSGEDLYRQPVSAEVARFLGELNEVAGRVSSIAGPGSVRGYVVDTLLGPVRVESARSFGEGDRVLLAARPEAVTLANAEGAPQADSSPPAWIAIVRSVTYQGAFIIVRAMLGGQEFVVHLPDGADIPARNARVALQIAPARWLMMPEPAPGRSGDEPSGPRA